MNFELKSAAFMTGAMIPEKYTADGPDVSPPLTWTSPPPGTKSFALICDDPDAPVGTWIHWIVYGIKPDARELRENAPKDETLPTGATQGMNDFRRVGYGGPAPPRGAAHRYFFKLFALDTQVTLAPAASEEDLRHAMKGHVLAEVQTMGLYQR